MEKMRLNYYYLKDMGTVAKGFRYQNWIYRNGEWVKDTKSLVWDKLIGYDPGEPEGSPYGIGSISVMSEIKRISYEEAMDIIGERIIRELIQKWSEKFQEEKKIWDQKPERPAKLVETSFCLFGTRYTIKPEDLGFEPGPEDEGFMESMQKEMEKDLADAGATEITSCWK